MIARPGVGELYPWRVVQAHARTLEMHRKIDVARTVLDRAADQLDDWRIAFSCGKDSTALAALCSEDGHDWTVMSIKDDLDYPGELEYAVNTCGRLGLDLDLISPDVSLVAWLRDNNVSLINPLHGRADELSAVHFYGLIKRYREEHGHRGVLLGLRAAEGPGRALNYQQRGHIYTKSDGLVVAQPLATWTSLDVHAFLASRDIDLLRVYMCIDHGMLPLSIRKSWWVAGGGPANHGHYTWLRRWWPEQWEIARSIDPNVERLS